MHPRHALLALLLPVCLGLTACDLLGDEALANAKEAEGRAIGSGCRHAGRSLEDCYKINAKASKAAIFAGWRDMDGYMRENKIEIIPPSAESAHTAAEAHTEEGAPKAADATANHAKTDTPPPPPPTPASADTKSPTKPEAGKGKSSATPALSNTAPENAASRAAPSTASSKPTPKSSH